MRLIPALRHDVAAGNRNQRAVCATQFSFAVADRQLVVALERQRAAGEGEDRVRSPLRLVVTGRGWRPRPLVVKSIFDPSLLNVAECQKEKFESDTAPIRFGLAASRMSSKSRSRRTRRQQGRCQDRP